MKSRALLAIVVLLVCGCSHRPVQGPMDLEGAAIRSKEVRVGVAMTPLPKTDMYLPGAGCLLCIAAATVANNSLIDYSRTLPLDDLRAVKEEVAKLIQAKGATVVMIPEPFVPSTLQKFQTDTLGFGEVDFRPLKEKFGVDKLVVLEVRQIGIERTYSAYIPTGDPKAMIEGRGFAIDLTTNKYLWYQPVNVHRASDKQWDEPPKFPGLTNAYFQVVEQGKDVFTKPFE